MRFAGCNLACEFCDTDFRVKETYTAEELAEEIARMSGGCRWVCFTGGEPTIHDLQALCDLLHGRGYRLQMETNGTRPRPDWEIDHVTVSPKQPQGGRLHPWYEQNAIEFKYVVDDAADLERALDGVQAHGQDDVRAAECAQSRWPSRFALKRCKRHPTLLRLSLQTHKFLDIR